MTPPIDQSERKHASKFARGPLLAVGAACLMAIAASAWGLLRIRSRLDSGLWLLCGVMIAVLFVVSISLAIWQQKRQRNFRPPWPEPKDNPYFGKSVSEVSFEGKFALTPAMFERLTRNWLRETPEGKSHRLTLRFLSATGLAGVAGGIVFLCLHEWSAVALIAVSLVLLLFAYSCRIRFPDEVRRGATIHWQFSNEKLVLSGGDRPREIFWNSTQAILRTPAGFILWPGDFITAILPIEAFGNTEQIDLSAAVMRSVVFNYVDETSVRKKN